MDYFLTISGRKIRNSRKPHGIKHEFEIRIDLKLPNSTIVFCIKALIEYEGPNIGLRCPSKMKSFSQLPAGKKTSFFKESIK